MCFADSIINSGMMKRECIDSNSIAVIKWERRVDFHH